MIVIGCRSTTRVAQLAVLGRRRRLVAVLPFAPRRIVERPMLHLALAALHHDAADLVERLRVFVDRADFGKVQVRFRHPQLGANAVEAQLAVGPREAQRERLGRLAAVDHPFVHAPEMACRRFSPKLVHQPRHQRQLLGRSDRPADARRVDRRVACRQAWMYSSASAR